jgi:hypothetical protein
VNPTQLFLFIGLPTIVGIAGVLAGETFRAKNMVAKSATPEGLGAKRDVVSEEAKADPDMATILASIRQLIADGTPKPSNFFGGEDTELFSSKDDRFFDEAAKRYFDRGWEIRSKRSDVLVGTLRRTYGESFARGVRANEKLRDVLNRLDAESLSKLFHDYEAGTLYNILTFTRYLSQR